MFGGGSVGHEKVGFRNVCEFSRPSGARVIAFLSPLPGLLFTDGLRRGRPRLDTTRHFSVLSVSEAGQTNGLMFQRVKFKARAGRFRTGSSVGTPRE